MNRGVLTVVLLTSAVFAQSPPPPAANHTSECATVNRTAEIVTVSANWWDPVLAIGDTLANRFGIRLSVESPQWAFPFDTEDVADADPEFSATHNNAHYQIMKFHSLQVRFVASPDGTPRDVPSLLRQVVQSASVVLPYAYRLDTDGDTYSLVPTKTRNAHGQIEDVQPLLDRHVSIPPATRRVSEHAKIMAEQLSQQTGWHISCCQTVVTGVLWGTGKAFFEAYDKPARDVLKNLIALEEAANSQARNGRHAVMNRWIVGCDGNGAPWCFIDVKSQSGSECR